MGFYSEFIEACEKEQQRWESYNAKAMMDPEMFEDLQAAANLTAAGSVKRLGSSIGYFQQLAQMMKTAKIIRMSGAQCQVFMNTPAVEGQDSKWMKLPFRHVWLQLDEPFVFKSAATGRDMCSPNSIFIPVKFDDSEVKVRGVLLAELTAEDLAHNADWDGADLNILRLRDGRAVKRNEIDRMLGVHFISPIPETPFNEDSSVLLVMKDGSLINSQHDAYQARRAIMLKFIVHVINFLSSPSVKLVPAEPAVALQKARLKKGKEPLPGWYEITYRKHVNDYTPSKISTVPQWHHGFRYDVRGHFKRFTRGPMMGRVIWCPPHQRGLMNTLYKPKTYRTENAPGVPENLWQG